MLGVTQIAGFGASQPAAAVAASVVYTDESVDGSALTTYTFTTQSIGTAAASRRVVVGTGCVNGVTRTVSSVTVGGISAVQVSGAYAEGTGGGALVPSDLWIADVPTGTTATIEVTWSGACARCGIGVWAVYDLLSSTATDSLNSTADPMTGTIDCNAGGVIIGFATGYVVGANTTFTWTGITESFDTDIGAAVGDISGAALAFASAQTGLTVTADGASALAAGAFSVAAFA